MILYLDTSALVKRYLRELGSDEIIEWLVSAKLSGSSVLLKAEMAAAMSKAVRLGYIYQEEANASWERFLIDWPELAHIAVSESLVTSAAALAWDYKLRGYDSVHLASALAWREKFGEIITLTTFDNELWEAGQRCGLDVLPVDLDSIITA